MTLYHFSESPGIAVFDPRSPLARPEVEPLVWAVDEEHAWTYLFPRDCPRILLWKVAATTDSDWRRWAGANETGKVACIEHRWFERLRTTTLYRYTLPPDFFEPLTNEPWMFVSRLAVSPISVDTIDDAVAALGEAGVELRLMPSLEPFRGAWESTVHLSGIRLRNAVGWESESTELPRS